MLARRLVQVRESQRKPCLIFPLRVPPVYLGWSFLAFSQSVAFRRINNLCRINAETWFDSNPRFAQNSLKKAQLWSAEQVFVPSVHACLVSRSSSVGTTTFVADIFSLGSWFRPESMPSAEITSHKRTYGASGRQIVLSRSLAAAPHSQRRLGTVLTTAPLGPTKC
jgi:hypothetical protein